MKKIIYIFCLIVLGVGCSNSTPVNDSTNIDNTDEDGNPISPLKVELQFPHKDELCNRGTNITPEQSTVFFEWKASNVAESYTVYITNLLDGSIKQAVTTDDNIGVAIDRATPYSWYVEAKAGNEAEDSDTWKFYNAGDALQNYAPFIATVIAPEMAAAVNAGTITLNWSGTDVDNDIVGYDVYFDTNINPAIHASDTASTNIDVSVSSGAIYYWKIVTKDAAGNTSETGIYQFRVL